MAPCFVCNKKIVRNDSLINCSDCNNSFHAICAGMNANEVDFLMKNKKTWQCITCVNRKKNIRLSVGDDSFVAVNGATNDETLDIKTTLACILAEIADMKCSIQKNSTDTNLYFSNINEQITALAVTFEKLDHIEKMQNDLIARVAALECRYDDIEQSNKNSSIVIHGLNNQDAPLNQTVIKIINEGLGVTVQPNDITKCIKLNYKSSRPPILIKFTNRDVVDNVLKAKSKNLNNLKQLNKGDIFINEDITACRRKLLKEARIVKKSKNFKFVWTRKGNIMMRKDQGEPVVFIRTSDDLNNLI